MNHTTTKLDYTPWPTNEAAYYRQQGYWLDLPLLDILKRQVANNPHHTAIICGERRYSYQQLDEAANHLASALVNRGITNGNSEKTALVQLPNCAEFYITFFALLKCAIAPVNALFNHGRKELREFAAQIKPDVVILSCQHALMAQENSKTQLLDELSEHMDEPQQILWLDDEFIWHDGTFLTSQPPFLPPATSIVNDVAFFQLSGGSTGTPKLIPRTHNDYYYSIRQSAQICELNQQTISLIALPAPHNFTLSSPGALGVFYAGGTIVIAPSPNACECFALIERHQVTITALVPPALSLWLEYGHQAQLSSLKLIQVGGAKLSPAIAQRVKPMLNCQLQQVFGMAEGLVNYTKIDDDQWHICHTQGQPMCRDDALKILDLDNNPVPKGQTGQLWTKGPYTFRGYYQSPTTNEQAFDTQGFYCTGDLVRQTESGYLQVTGRIKEQINRGGEKIAAQEVEDLLHQHPQVLQASVVAIADEQLGEKSLAYIIAKSPIKGFALRRHLREQGLAEYKFPDKFEFVAELPQTAVGKIDKQQLSASHHH